MGNLKLPVDKCFADKLSTVNMNEVHGYNVQINNLQIWQAKRNTSRSIFSRCLVKVCQVHGCSLPMSEVFPRELRRIHPNTVFLGH